MIKVGSFEADYHSFHHPSLGTDLSVIQKQSNDRAVKGMGSVVIHHHTAADDCKDREHNHYNAPQKAV